MYDRVEKRLTAALLSLTLRKAVGLIVAVATLLAVAAAFLERVLEPKVFDTFPLALWFSISTVTTVGYGDIVPESGAGRLVASVLMLTGLGLIPLITSVVVSIRILAVWVRWARADPRAARQPRAQARALGPL